MVDAPLVISEVDSIELTLLRVRAEANVLDINRIKQNMSSPETREMHRQLMIDQTVRLGGGPWPFYATYSVESGHPIGTMRHLSVSIDRAGRVPSPAAVLFIAQYLGFIGDLCACDHVWVENLSGEGKAVNIIQKMEIVFQ